MRLVFANEATAARRRVYFHVVDATDGITAETGEAGGQPQVSSDGAAFTNTGIGTLSHLGNGRYSADLTQTLVATAGVSIETRYKSAATAETPGDSVQVVAFNPYSTSLDILLAAANLSADTITATKIATGAITAAKFAAGAIDAAAIATDAIDADAIADNAINAGAIATGAITAAKFAAGAIDAAAIATDAITAAKIAADAIGASELAADAVTEIQSGLATSAALATVQADTDDIQARLPAALVSGRMDSSVGAMAAGVVTAAAIATDAIDADALAADAGTEIAAAVDTTLSAAHGAGTWGGGGSAAIVTGTSDSGTTTTMVDAARTEADTDYWKGAWIKFTSGTISGQTRLITGFNAATDTITFTPATTQAVGTNTYEILAAAGVDVRLWMGSAPDVLSSGRVDTRVVAMDVGVITSTAIATDAIGSSELASSAIDEIVDQVWNELLSGHAVAGSTGEALSNAGSGASAATIADAVWDEARAGHVAGGSFGEGVASVQGNVTGSVASVTGNVGGNVTGSVGSIAAGGIAAASFAAGAIDSAAIATDAIGSAELAASAVTEIQSGLATSAAQTTAQTDLDDIQTRLPAALVSGRMDASVGAMAADVVTASAIATDAIGSAELAASAVNEIADQVWDELIAGHLGAGSTGAALNGASAPTAASVADAVWDELLADHVTANTMGANQNLIDNINSDTDDIQTRLPAALVSGRMDSSVGAMAAGVVTAAAVATDAIDSDAIAASAVTEIQSGLATSAALATVQADTDDIQTRLPAALVSGRMDSSVGAMAADVITAAAIATDAIGSAELAASAVNEIADQVWDELIAGHLGAGSTGEALANAAVSSGLTQQQVRDAMKLAPTAGVPASGSIDLELDEILSDLEILTSLISTTGTSDSGTTTTMVDAARTEADTDYWKGAWIKFTSGTISGQTRLITGFDPGTDTITFTPATTQTVGTQTYVILAAAGADLRLWNGTAPNNLISGRVDSSVGAMAAGVVTAAAVATDAIDADAIAASAVTEIQAGLATSAALATVQADTDDIQTRLPAALVGGRMDSSVGAMAAGVVTATAIATDAIDADALAASALAEINAEVDAALVDIRLDEIILNVASPITPTINSFWDRITSKDGSQTYDRLTDSLEGIADSAGTPPTAAAIADAVWDELLADHVTAATMGANQNLIDNINADTDDIQTRLPAALVGGRMDSSVGAMAADVVTASAIATDAIGSAELAASAVTEIQAGLATAAALATVQADTDDIQTRLPATLVGGRMRSHTEAMDAGVITAAVIATDAIDADALADGAITAPTFAAGAIDAAAIAADAIGSSELAASAVNEIADQVWDEVLSGHLTAGTTGAALNAAGSGASAATIADAVWDELLADHVTANTMGANQNLIDNINADTDDIQTRLPAALVSGRMDSSVGAMAADVVTAAAIATDAIGSAELAASAVNEIADQVWDELRAGHVGAGSFGEGVASVQGNVTGSVASVTGNVGGNVVGSVGSVTGNVGGNVTGSVGSVAAGGITAASIATNAIDADALATDAVNEIVDQVWEEQIGDHSGTVGSTAEALDAAASGGSAPSAAVIADAVWDELLAGHVLAGSTGEAQNMIDDILTDTAAIQPLVDVAVSTRATPAQVNTEVDTALSDIRLDELIFNVAAPITPTIDSFIDRITSKNGAQTYDRSTDSLEAASDAIVAAGPSAAIIADAVWDEALAGHLTVGSTGAALDAIGDDLDTIMGPGFDSATDSLEEIRDEVDACCGVSSGGEVINIEGI